ncbi:MAG TPA: hypothetical protein VG077_06260 [Verrucomicrobiae bacterium]|nr:hypothetical protein [Verrucomicrobiae bacterium]
MSRKTYSPPTPLRGNVLLLKQGTTQGVLAQTTRYLVAYKSNTTRCIACWRGNG